ncbi:DEAD/DEAH box helicase [Edaphobacter acidisoli]|uniref:DEAD/DEAH box helicase n=1 Tax=Edaphobacter acidisoli TaxID=2040573 RepID=A0A916W1G6_9BACT|nr:DEAD/DEAH box helicase [Edaphobacter acidisoli]GGA58554.1 DEAD/DEAH box helicase [Edaphobacter acidisoli]
MPRVTSKSNASRETAKAGSSGVAETDTLALFHPITARWFRKALGKPTAPQVEGWPAIARGESTLILAPTGTGKTLTAFLWCIDRLMMRPENTTASGCRVIYVSPLKALAVDVERNLQMPLHGIAEMAKQEGIEVQMPEISVRTGDTSQRERARFKRHPADILITTPESLYLLLTSDAAESLRSVETVIIDEIHALVPSKRGAHLMLSVERLESLTGRRLQRIGLSATQRPLEEVARFLGGAESSEPMGEIVAEVAPTSNEDRAEQLIEKAVFDGSTADRALQYRSVTVVNAGARKALELRVEVSVEDMARLGARTDGPSRDDQEKKQTSIWQSIYPRVLELLRERRSTLIFVNARRTAERLAGALNELAGEPLARAHHGSLAASQRAEIETLLKAGEIRALVATSSLELGIDMGAIDLVVQIEAPPSVAAGMQRIGRAGHRVGVPSSGVIFPKYRGDLVACAAVTRAMHEGHVESTRFLRNPLDVLAQQIVAIVAHPPIVSASARRYGEDDGPGIGYEELFALVRRCAPFSSLSSTAFDGVLDMLSGRYPSDEFAELRPRITWDRINNWLTPRSGVKRVAILNAGTIPDRGLYGVFLAGEHAKPVRVGELDEEMVFESKPGEVFTLGASSWRIEEITQDRVLVSPAPGEAGKMPFWHGDRAGRPLEFGRRIGALVRELREAPHSVGMARLTTEHDLAPDAAENVLRYLTDQQLATTIVPDDRSIVVERVRDELGFWRVCVLTPFGSRVHAPWAVAAAAKVSASGGPDVETMWSEDGFVLRFPETDEPPSVAPLLLEPAEAASLVIHQLGATALFAAKFRESAARALLLPRRRADGRTPLWQQRKRAYDLLSVASRYSSFPILLEAYRECLRDVFDMPALAEILRGIESSELLVHTVDTTRPSPFASAVLFSYVANYIYDGDAPLAERRAQALTIDQNQLRELMGEADLRELLDPNAMDETEKQLQCLAEGYRARDMDAVHDMLLRLGDLSREELRTRCATEEIANSAAWLLRIRRAIEIEVADEKRLIAVEDAARYRDALGLELPKGLPAVLLAPVTDAMLDLMRRFARTHGPFTAHEAARRFGVSVERVEPVLERLVQSGRVAEGGFRPEGSHREWCDVEVLRTIRRKSLARLRKEIEPVEERTLARLITRWQGVVQPRRGLDALLDTIETLQGAALPASILETEILPARISNYKPADLDILIAAGEVVWCGIESLGEHDGRIALYLAEKLPALWAPVKREGAASEREQQIVDYLREHGASFFAELHEGIGGGYPGETVAALWSLVWKGLVTNDGMAALRAYCERPASSKPARRVHQQTGFHSRRTTPPAAQGRWALQRAAFADERPTPERMTEWSHAMAQQLLARYGVVFRETAHAENLPGGFSAVYDVMKAMEESGKLRRGYFVAELGATQFAVPAAVDLLRSLRAQSDPARVEIVQLAAADPANPYGALLRWPEEGMALTRSVGARVILCDGDLVVYMRRDNPNVQMFLPEDEPQRSHVAERLAKFLVEQVQAQGEEDLRAGMLIATINGGPVAEHWIARYLLEAGFSAGARGFNVRKQRAAGATQQRSY